MSKYTCGDCPWGGNHAVLELGSGDRVDVWQYCPANHDGGLTAWYQPECELRKAFRVVRDAYRATGKLANNRKALEEIGEYVLPPEPNANTEMKARIIWELIGIARKALKGDG